VSVSVSSYIEQSVLCGMRVSIFLLLSVHRMDTQPHLPTIGVRTVSSKYGSRKYIPSLQDDDAPVLFRSSPTRFLCVEGKELSGAVFG